MIKYGFNTYFSEQCTDMKEEKLVGRVSAQLLDYYEIITSNGISKAKVTGRFTYSTKANKDFPVVGDFVVLQKTINNNILRINRVLGRRNTFSRKMPISGGRKLYKGMIDGGVTEEQVIAANIDYAMILCGLDKNFNISRLERYILLASKSKLNIVVILTKSDLCDNYAHYIDEVHKIDRSIKVHAISSKTGEGLDRLNTYLKPQKTIALLGSSGVGKSTLLNALFKNNIQETKSLSGHSGKGKHTTTMRRMFIHDDGFMLIDTPGIKEVQLWADINDLKYLYSDIIELESSCKYNNCGHTNEPQCSIKEALQSGELSRERYERYLKMQKELYRLSERKKEYRKRSSKKRV